MDVLLKIEEINKVLQEYFEDDIYDLFMNKYCFEYYLILKKYYPLCELVINRENNHCAIKIDGINYDVCGIAQGLYELANYQDLCFIKSFYNRFTYNERCLIEKRLTLKK